MPLKRVVITGIGAVSPFGGDCAVLFDGIAAGRGAVVSRREAWGDYRNLRSLVAAPAADPDEKAVPRVLRRSMSRMSFFAYDAARQALTDALGATDASNQTEHAVQQALTHFQRGRLGCVLGSTIGSPISLTESFETLLPERDVAQLNAFRFFQCMSHTAAMNVAQCLGLTGVTLATNAACASGLQAVGAAFDAIRLGNQDAILCGGAEELHPMVTGSFDVLFAASTGYNASPERTPRPFDRDRDGIVCGEGAGVLLLEEREHALRRGARIYAEICGWHTCASGEHVSQSSRPALVHCLRTALSNAGVTPGEVDYINAHAAGTIQGDAEEAAAIGEIFGNRVPVSSLKGHLGHTLGASGALELIASLLMMQKGVLFPTRNLETPGEDCAQIRHLTAPLQTQVEILLKNSFAFGGINSALVCRKGENRFSLR